MEHLAEICCAYGNCVYYKAWKHYSLDLAGSLADLLADLHETYKIVKLIEHTRGSSTLDVILDVGKTPVRVCYSGTHKVFSDRFNRLRKLCISANSNLDYSGGSVKYFYNFSNDNINISHVDYMARGVIENTNMDYYSEELYYTREVVAYDEPIFEYDDIRIRQYYYQGGEFVYADRYRCDISHLQDVLEFKPKCIIVEGCVSADNLAPLYTCQVPKIKISARISAECIIKLLENPYIRYLSVQSMDEPIEDISPYRHLVQFKVRYNKNDRRYFHTKCYREQLLSMPRRGLQVKSARSV